MINCLNLVSSIFLISYFELICSGDTIDLEDPLVNTGSGPPPHRYDIDLVNHLFEENKYNPLIRPVRRPSDKLIVDFGMAMVQVINVDEKKQIMKSNVWLRVQWKDFQLSWDPNKFGGISVIRLMSHKVWMPDIILFNTADGKYKVTYNPNVVIHSEGTILWIPPTIFKSSCTIDVRYFPFDEQICELKFGSWTYNGDQMELDWYEDLERVDLNDYIPSGTWDIMGCPGTKQVYYDHIDRHNKSEITFSIVLRRKSLFYTINLIVPCVFIGLLTVGVFYLPIDAQSKISMSVSIMLAIIVFFLLVSKLLPPSSTTTPLIAQYLLFLFIMNLFSLMFTVCVINWSYRTPRTHKFPLLLRTIFINWLPRLLFLKKPDHDQRCDLKKSAVKVIENSVSGVLYSMYDFSTSTFRTSFEPKQCFKCSTDLTDLNSDYNLGTDNTGNTHRKGQLNPEMMKAIEAVRFVAAHLRNEDDYNEIINDWRYVSMVLDRILLFIFFGIVITGSIGTVINAPHIFQYVDQDAVIRNITGGK